MTKKESSLVTIPKKNWEAGQGALELLTELKQFLKGDQQEVPKNIQRYLRKDKAGNIKISMWCPLCTENHILRLSTVINNTIKKQVCQHNIFQKSEIV